MGTAPLGPATGSGPDTGALALLDDIASNLLSLFPESATLLGIDVGARAGLRSRLTDRSAEGKQRIAGQLRSDLDRLNAFSSAGLSYSTRTSFDVVRSAFNTALEGFALPYGDITVGGWRNTPYVVIQNVSAYLDIPRFLDSDHRVETASDAEAYLARLESYARQLDGELGRMKAAREIGLVPPAFLIDKALRQISLRRAGDVRTAARGGVLPLGAQGFYHDDHVTRRCPRAWPERGEEAARADGHDPEGDRLHAWQRDDSATFNQSLSVHAGWSWTPAFTPNGGRGNRA